VVAVPCRLCLLGSLWFPLVPSKPYKHKIVPSGSLWFPRSNLNTKLVPSGSLWFPLVSAVPCRLGLLGSLWFPQKKTKQKTKINHKFLKNNTEIYQKSKTTNKTKRKQKENNKKQQINQTIKQQIKQTNKNKTKHK